MKDLSLHILDLVQNSLRAGARLVEINIVEQEEKDLLQVEIKDNGKGIPSAALKKVLDPFYTTRTTRRVGLGLSLFQAAACRTGGHLIVEPLSAGGTRVSAAFGLRHWDRPPLGDMAETLLMLIVGNPEVDFIYQHRRNGKEYRFDTREIKKVLEEVDVTNPVVLNYLRRELKKELADFLEHEL